MSTAQLDHAAVICRERPAHGLSGFRRPGPRRIHAPTLSSPPMNYTDLSIRDTRRARKSESEYFDQDFTRRTQRLHCIERAQQRELDERTAAESYQLHSKPEPSEKHSRNRTWPVLECIDTVPVHRRNEQRAHLVESSRTLARCGRRQRDARRQLPSAAHAASHRGCTIRRCPSKQRVGRRCPSKKRVGRVDVRRRNVRRPGVASAVDPAEAMPSLDTVRLLEPSLSRNTPLR
jgi:hypothetical protein